MAIDALRRLDLALDRRLCARRRGSRGGDGDYLIDWNEPLKIEEPEAPMPKMLKSLAAENSAALFAILAVIVTGTPALAGSCRYYMNGSDSVKECSNGYFEVEDRKGVRRYGIENGGFERYPGQRQPSYRMRGDD